MTFEIYRVDTRYRCGGAVANTWVATPEHRIFVRWMFLYILYHTGLHPTAPTTQTRSTRKRAYPMWLGNLLKVIRDFRPMTDSNLFLIRPDGDSVQSKEPPELCYAELIELRFTCTLYRCGFRRIYERFRFPPRESVYRKKCRLLG